MGNKYTTINALESGWESKAAQFASSGLPFILQNIDFIQHQTLFALLEELANQQGLEAAFNLTEKEALFEKF